MDEKSLYAYILNLTTPWQVKFLSIDEKVGSVTVIVGIAENAPLSCPTCGRSCPIHDHRYRKWRHLDICQFSTRVEADIPRLICPEHGCLTPGSVGRARQSLHTVVRILRALMAEN